MVKCTILWHRRASCCRDNQCDAPGVAPSASIWCTWCVDIVTRHAVVFHIDVPTLTLYLTCKNFTMVDFALGEKFYYLLTNTKKNVTRVSESEWDWLFNVTFNDISVIYVTAHRCARGLKKKLNLRSGYQRHKHFVGFFNEPVQARTRDHPL